MSKLTASSSAVLLLEVEYLSKHGQHCEYYYCPQVNLQDDLFTEEQLQRLCGLGPGESKVLESGFQPYIYDPGAIAKVWRSQWRPPDTLEKKIEPRLGRWYPQGFISGRGGVFSPPTAPLRVTALADEHIEVDRNHPLAGRELQVSAYVQQVCEPAQHRGDGSTDWLHTALSGGPGMQISPANYAVDYSEPDGLQRKDDGDDALFYTRPRMVNHLDGQAQQHLHQFTAGVIDDDMKVLDLMSSIESHVTASPEIHGLGMNHDELLANPKLSRRVVQDLNRDPHLPYDDEEFDVVCCHLSFEYLLHPRRIMQQCARVLKQDGVVVLSFSNRWFPGKVTMLWQKLHEYERIGFVIACLQGAFNSARSISYRNWPRPADDPHYSKLQTSDPLYIVTAQKAPLC